MALAHFIGDCSAGAKWQPLQQQTVGKLKVVSTELQEVFSIESLQIVILVYIHKLNSARLHSLHGQ